MAPGLRDAHQDSRARHRHRHRESKQGKALRAPVPPLCAQCQAEGALLTGPHFDNFDAAMTGSLEQPVGCDPFGVTYQMYCALNFMPRGHHNMRNHIKGSRIGKAENRYRRDPNAQS